MASGLREQATVTWNLIKSIVMDKQKGHEPFKDATK